MATAATSMCMAVRQRPETAGIAAEVMAPPAGISMPRRQMGSIKNLPRERRRIFQPLVDAIHCQEIGSIAAFGAFGSSIQQATRLCRCRCRSQVEDPIAQV